MKKQGAVDWEVVGEKCGKRFGSSCFNKYVQLSEPEWTAEQEETLGKYWEENNRNFNVDDIVPKLDGHSRRGTQFRLERLADPERGRFRPAYKMGKDEMLKTE